MKTKEQREIDIKHFNLGYEKGKAETFKEVGELIVFGTPLKKYQKFRKLKEAKE